MDLLSFLPIINEDNEMKTLKIFSQEIVEVVEPKFWTGSFDQWYTLWLTSKLKTAGFNMDKPINRKRLLEEDCLSFEQEE